MIVAKAFPKRPAQIGGVSRPPDSVAAHAQEKIAAALRQQEGVDTKKKKKRPRKRNRRGKRQQQRLHTQRKCKSKMPPWREAHANNWEQGAMAMKKRRGKKRSRR